jgi:hypothetical protein
MKKSVFLYVVILSQLVVVAFAADQPVASATTSPAQAADAATPAAPPGHPAMPATSSPTTATEAVAAPVSLSGTVLQTMNAGGYSYVYIEQKDGRKVWVAVAETPVKVGAQMSFKPGMEMGKFESKALKRTFDSIVFSDGVISGAAKSPAADPAKEQGTSPGSSGASAAKAAKISVTKAAGDNAYTVEEAYKNSSKLNKKKVVISGQVVKVSIGIMDKNWIHIQDGTGSDKKKTHNLVCTSKTDTADVGDVVTITGTLIKDRDFGSGYKYSVIIEDSKITK